MGACEAFRCAFLLESRGEAVRGGKESPKFKHFTAISGVNKNLHLNLVETNRSLPEIPNDLAVNRE